MTYPETSVEKVRTSLGILLVNQGGANLRGWHILAGVPSDLDEQMASCRRRLTEIVDELRSAKGDRRRFLLAAKHRWEGKLELVRLNAGERQAEVRAIQAELNAWNRGSEH